MKNAPSSLASFIATSNVAWRADLLTLTLSNGTVLRWTSCDRDLSVGGYTYTAGPVLSRRLRQGLLPEIDTLSLDLAGAFSLGSVSLSLAALQGSFDDARINVDHLIGAYPGDLSKGVIAAWFAGRVSGIEPTPTTLRMDCKSDLEELSIVQLPRFTFRPMCGNIVYDANCGVSRAALTTATTVAATPAPTTTVVGLSSTTKANNYFNLGVLAFTSGGLTGIRRAVQSYSAATNAVTLAMPLPFAPTAGDGLTVYPGCSRSWATCSAVFANTAAFRGTPHTPTPDGGI